MKQLPWAPKSPAVCWCRRCDCKVRVLRRLFLCWECAHGLHSNWKEQLYAHKPPRAVGSAAKKLSNIAWHIGEEIMPDPEDEQWNRHMVDLRAALDETDAVLARLDRPQPAAPEGAPPAP